MSRFRMRRDFGGGVLHPISLCAGHAILPRRSLTRAHKLLMPDTVLRKVLCKRQPLSALSSGHTYTNPECSYNNHAVPKSTVCQCTTCIVSADRCLSSQTAKGIRLSDSFSRHIARGTRASIRSCLRCAG